jgi:1-acyl-sn-glycerol-3-phosphate acyltransferase
MSGRDAEDASPAVAVPPGRSPAAGKPGLASLAWYALARGVVELVCRAYFRVRIVGKSRIPASGAYVIAPVHRSNVDTLLAGCLVRRRIRFMGKDSLWKYRWSAALFDSLGAFPVQRGTPDREALRVCEDALGTGEPVVLFPEGTRQTGSELHPLFEGAAFVAARARVPIVPVGIGGSEWAMPKGSRWILPVKVVMVVGEPLAPPARTGGRVSRRAVASTTEELARRLQSAFDEALKYAGRA